MTVSMRVTSAGDGRKYLLKPVTAGDGGLALSTPLTTYCAEAGTLPGRWRGSGVVPLGDGQVAVGSQVSEAQLQLLVGMGRGPLTGDPLGRAYPVYASAADRIAKHVADLDPSLGIVEVWPPSRRSRRRRRHRVPGVRSAGSDFTRRID